MKRKFLISFISIVVLTLTLAPVKLSAQVQTLCDGSSTSIMDGEYNVMNNIWGSGEGVGDQCIEVNMDSAYFKVTLSTHHNNSVASYPSIFKGCHWGWCTTNNNPMPVNIKKIESAPSIWVIKTVDDTGTWNPAYDIWFDNSSSFLNDYDAELMIWLDYHGGAAPAGSHVADVEIGGLTWEVYFTVFTNWNYIAYKVSSPVDSVNLDLKDFFVDACTRGYLYTSWYLHAIEAGFEITSGGQGLTSEYFSADVMVSDTISWENFAPTSFILLYPQDERTMNTNVITFRWRESKDADQDPISYIFHLSGAGKDTVITMDTINLYFDGSDYFSSDSVYTWYVESTDNKDTTESTTRRTFTAPGVVGIKDNKNLPNEFYLYQNYPNPFNPSTKILYSLKNSGMVRLSIYDPLGRQIAVLVNGYQNAGEHETTFSGTDLPSGIYYYRLQTGNKTITKKMALLK
jgi:hypothetical protein